ncbi:CPBP family glutamic-type intramembrane protease [Candidatus Lokiarchaeum ossiferum]|uniref:CPBP family glutamic-type intramembrane protease n=1 Tax=Candidatus Lokiarchaeum ossiferum TaxID=2951803 RepID=UPI00352C025A
MEENPNKDTRNSDPKPADLSPNPDEFYCPRCHSTSLLSNNPLFCHVCGYAFPVGRNKEILIDHQNYAVFTSDTTPMSPTSIAPLNNNAIGQSQSSISPTLRYPASYPQMYPQMGYSPIHKQRKWNVLAGFLVPLITYIGIIILTIIPAALTVFSGNGMNSVFVFIVGSFSLFFLIVPIWWVNRYYPGKLTLRQRLDVLGLPFDKYTKPELVREILLGIFLGLIMVFLALGFQIIGSIIVKAFYGVDVITFMEGIEFDDFDLTSPGQFWELLLFVLQMALFVGYSEEVMFRGFVQRSFESKMNKPASLLLTAVFFGLFHIYVYIVMPPIFLFFLIVYLGISIFLGLVRNWRKDLIAAGSAHIIYNCIQTIIIYFIFL